MLTEDLVLTPTLLRRFEIESEFEGGNGRHYALIQRNDGSLLSHHPASPSIEPFQAIWAAQVLKLLNRELHHDGAWCVVFTHPKPPSLENIFQDAKHAQYARYVLLWLDADGDVQIPFEWMEGTCELRTFSDIMIAGPVSTAQKCELAWEIWHDTMIKVLEPREGQTFKRARGERPSSARH
jgi:hypothetical protein